MKRGGMKRVVEERRWDKWTNNEFSHPQRNNTHTHIHKKLIIRMKKNEEVWGDKEQQLRYV